jgi:hypothetical protein
MRTNGTGAAAPVSDKTASVDAARRVSAAVLTARVIVRRQEVRPAVGPSQRRRDRPRREPSAQPANGLLQHSGDRLDRRCPDRPPLEQQPEDGHADHQGRQDRQGPEAPERTLRRRLDQREPLGTEPGEQERAPQPIRDHPSHSHAPNAMPAPSASLDAAGQAHPRRAAPRMYMFRFITDAGSPSKPGGACRTAAERIGFRIPRRSGTPAASGNALAPACVFLLCSNLSTPVLRPAHPEARTAVRK